MEVVEESRKRFGKFRLELPRWRDYEFGIHLLKI
jgi:hypothetical protein